MEKNKQKQLITEIMNEDAKDGLYKKQTAVEWLVQEINKINVSTEARMFINKLKDQAKEIEKEQRINDFRSGIDCESDHHGYMWTDIDYPNQWYEELQGENNEQQ